MRWQICNYRTSNFINLSRRNVVCYWYIITKIRSQIKQSKQWITKNRTTINHQEIVFSVCTHTSSTLLENIEFPETLLHQAKSNPYKNSAYWHICQQSNNKEPWYTETLLTVPLPQQLIMKFLLDKLGMKFSQLSSITELYFLIFMSET